MFSINKALGMVPNASEHGYLVDQMLEACHWFMTILFIGWSSYFVYTLWRFHNTRSPKADYYGVQSKASAHLEFSVVVVEAILLLGFALPLWGKRVNGDPFINNPESLKVRVIAEQFAWTFHYPGADGVFGRQSQEFVTPDNPLGLDPNDPAGKDDFFSKTDLHIVNKRPTVVEISSKDVIHSFALKSMRIEQDAIPGSRIPIWFRPIQAGVSEIICAQLCGAGHAKMRGEMTVESQADFDSWAKGQLELQHPNAAPAAPAAAPAAAK